MPSTCRLLLGRTTSSAATATNAEKNGATRAARASFRNIETYKGEWGASQSPRAGLLCHTRTCAHKGVSSGNRQQAPSKTSSSRGVVGRHALRERLDRRR